MSSSSALRLRSAIERCQVYPVFQPIVRIESGAVAGFEVLARWDDAEQGSISPAVFIPLAQNAGLLQKLTGQLLERACREAASWCSAVTLSVNIAPELLQDGGLARMVLDTARATGFTPSRLCIEITEQALEPVWLPHARTTLELLKQHGVKLALDDFGTGHSSLSRLQELPFDSLKIDMSFVQSMLQRRESRKIVAAVIGLGQSLGLSVVAEGVQTPAQLALLRELGCCLGQGFHYGAGLTAIQAAAAISSRRVVQAIHSGRPLDRSPNQRLAQLQSIYDSSLVAIAFIDQDRRVVSANAPFTELCDVPGHSMQGACIDQVMPFLKAGQRDALTQALGGDVIPQREIWLQGRCYMVSCRAVKDEVKEIMGVSLAMVDITERKSVERDLRTSEEHYRNTVELSPQCSWVAEPNGHFLYISPKYQEAVGRSLHELQDAGWAQVLHPDYREKAYAAWAHSLRTGDIHDVDVPVWYVRFQEYRWTRCYAAPCRRADGAIVRWYGTVEDIHAPNAPKAIWTN